MTANLVPAETGTHRSGPYGTNPGNSIVSTTSLRADAQQSLAAVKVRINELDPKIFTPEIKEMLSAKLHTSDQGQSQAGLGKQVDSAKMNEMLNELSNLSKNLSPEHVRAILLAGYVRGGGEVRPGVRGGGVQGVIDFIKLPENAQYLKADGGYNAIQGLLESKEYKRTFTFIHTQTNFIQGVLGSTLQQIFGEEVLSDWVEDIQQAELAYSQGGRTNPHSAEHVDLGLDADGIDPRFKNRLGDGTHMRAAGCWLRSKYLSDAISGGKHWTSYTKDESLKGQSVLSLTGANLKLGDIIYLSTNPHSNDVNSVNMNNLPHHGCVIGIDPKTGEPLISDNWDRCLTLSDWSAKYGAAGRRVHDVLRV
jgi:hypothetical protein